MSKSKEYRAWSCIKDRCYRIKTHNYKDYGGSGITFDFKDDFIGFLLEVGEQPKDGEKYSIDRIDNSKGYVKGNMRWATDNQQARNRGVWVANTSGITGVYWENTKKGTNLTRAIAKWSDLDGKLRSKSFSVTKLGLLPAFAEAVRYRRKMIEELNKQGAGYSEKHGL